MFFNRFSTNPDLTPGGGIIPAAPPPPADQDGPIRMGAYYTTIPESSSVLGMLAFAALGASLQLKKHKNKKQLA